MSEQEQQVPIDKLTKIYIKIRDAREELARKYDEEDNVLKQQQNTIKSELLRRCKELNVDSLRTQYGTAVRKVQTRYWTSDWESMYNFIKENDALNLLEQRVHQTNMKTFLSEHPELRPPGLNADCEYVITIYPAKKKL